MRCKGSEEAYKSVLQLRMCYHMLLHHSFHCVHLLILLVTDQHHLDRRPFYQLPLQLLNLENPRAYLSSASFSEGTDQIKIVYSQWSAGSGFRQYVNRAICVVFLNRLR
jgi:hypothetical protein